MKTVSDFLNRNLSEQKVGHIASEHGAGKKTPKGENVKSSHGPDAVEEQHAEEGRFKPVVPHNVKSVAGGRTRPTSDSANVKLKEESMELNEGKMGQIHADIGEKLDKHIDDYKAHGGAEHLGAKTVKAAGHIAKLHGLEPKHAQKFVNDYVENRLREGQELAVEETKPYWKKPSWQKKMSNAAKKQNRKDDVPFDPPYTKAQGDVKDKSGAVHTPMSRVRHLARMAAKNQSGIKEETLEEGRPSQRHPLEGHEYHRKSNDELIHIAKDAHAAAEAMKSHNTAAENKYRDQANDSATVRHFRKMSGTPDWYKKKYGLKEGLDMCPICGQTPCNCTHITEAWDQPDYNQSIKARQAAADKKSRKAQIIRTAHDKAKVKKQTQKEGSKDKFEADPELTTQIIRND